LYPEKEAILYMGPI